MATTTPVSRPIGIYRPSNVGRWAIFGAALVVAGVAMGMILDTGRNTVSPAAPALRQGQLAVEDRLADQADLLRARQAATQTLGARSQPPSALRSGRLEALAAQQAAAQRLQGLSESNEFASIIADLETLPSAQAPVGSSPQVNASIQDAEVHGGYYDVASGTWMFGPEPQPPGIAERGDFTAVPTTAADLSHPEINPVGGDRGQVETTGNVSFDDFGFRDAGYTIDETR